MKSEVDKAEESCDTAKSEVSKITKELASITKQINQIEASLDNERASRHTILKQCKMDGIGIPMRKGRLEDIDDDGEDASIEMSSSQPSHIIYEREEKIKIDYSGLNVSLQDLEEADDVRKVERTFEKQISDLNATIHKIQAPNMKAMQKLDEAREKLAEANKDFDTVRRKAKQAKQNFERVKQERYDLFMACFEHVSNTIDGIYKSLARNQSAQAFLGPENPEEPYLEVRSSPLSLSAINKTLVTFLYRASTTTVWLLARGSSPCPTCPEERKPSRPSPSSSPSTATSRLPFLSWTRSTPLWTTPTSARSPPTLRVRKAP